MRAGGVTAARSRGQAKMAVPTAATIIAVTWPTAATFSWLRPPKMSPTATRSTRSTAAAARAGQEPSSSAMTMADTTTYDGPMSMR